MTRDMQRIRDDERGATTVLVGLLLVVLLGATALVVDVGAAYAEKAQLQNGADSAALAIAQACAAGDCGDPDETSFTLAGENANDRVSGAAVEFPDENTVRVLTDAREAGAESNSFSLFFAQALGYSSTQIGAAAEASWGPPSGATTLPWTAHQCVFRNSLSASQLAEFDAFGTFAGNPSTTLVLLRYDKNATAPSGCPSEGYRPGGFGWLEVTSTGCKAAIDLDATVDGQPGNHFPNDVGCDSVLTHLMDEPALIPLYTSVEGNGENSEYTLIGFGAFQVTGYKFSGGDGVNITPTSACTGNCRALQGYFTRFVSLEDGAIGTEDAPNFGGSVVTLTD